jgi:hypothetical protein
LVDEVVHGMLKGAGYELFLGVLFNQRITECGGGIFPNLSCLQHKAG